MPVLDPADFASETVMGTKHAAGQVKSGAVDFGKEFFGQLFGLKNGDSVPTDEEVNTKDSEDKEFSDAAYAETLARVHQMYADYAAKKRQEELARQAEENEKKQEKVLDDLNKKRKHYQDVQVAVGKASAETGRSYGAGE